MKVPMLTPKVKATGTVDPPKLEEWMPEYLETGDKSLVPLHMMHKDDLFIRMVIAAAIKPCIELQASLVELQRKEKE